jgi:hypothetical protein
MFKSAEGDQETIAKNFECATVSDYFPGQCFLTEKNVKIMIEPFFQPPYSEKYQFNSQAKIYSGPYFDRI